MIKKADQHNKNKGIAKKALIGVFAFLLGAFFIYVFININYFRSIFSLKQINKAPIYEFHVYHDYRFDDYLKVGAANVDELVDFFFGRRKAPRPLDFNGSGCSAFLAKTPEGDIILGRNYDWYTSLSAIMHTRSKRTGRCIALTNLNHSGIEKLNANVFDKERVKLSAAPFMTLDGMNEHGLAAAIFTAKGSQSSIDPNKVTLFDLTVIRAILDNARTTREAIDFISKYNVAHDPEWPSQYMVADASGKSAIIEFVKGKMKVIENTDNYQVCTNFIIYDNPDLKGFGDYRYRTIERYIKENGGALTTEAAIDLLKNNVIHSQGQWSAVYNLTKKTVSVVFVSDYTTLYQRTFN